MTFYCRLHPSFEGTDVGKLHDHAEKDHPELVAGIENGQLSEYRRRYQRLFNDDIYEIKGPVRHSDTMWLNRYHGRQPKLGLEIADNEVEKK